jgi:hypothetical protein
VRTPRKNNINSTEGIWKITKNRVMSFHADIRNGDLRNTNHSTASFGWKLCYTNTSNDQWIKKNRNTFYWATLLDKIILCGQ